VNARATDAGTRSLETNRTEGGLDSAWNLWGLIDACRVPSLIFAAVEYESFCCRTHFLEPESLRETSHGKVIVISVVIGEGTGKSG